MKYGLCHAAFALMYTLTAQATDKPNVIFILADDLGYRETGSYGQEKIKTPRLDELAAAGMRFTRAYSGNAVCAPSRCVLMTGKHPGHATVRNNRSVEPEGQYPIRTDEVTLGELFQKAGYACGAFGKWGLGNEWSEGSPKRSGFDRFFGYNCQSKAHTYYPDTLWSDGELFPLENDPPVPGHAGLPKGADPADPASYAIFQGRDYAPDQINGAALEFIRSHRDEPFFLYYPSILPHVALHVPDEDLAPYHAENWDDPPFTRSKSKGYTPHFTPRAAYAAMITRLDTYVGRVIDLVEELELTENTIVVFTSDNGTTHLDAEVDYEFFASVGELRGLKGELYEGGIRIPQIVKWPGKIAPGSVSDHVTGFEDWLPTLMELIGSTASVPPGLDGQSLAAVLRGENVPERNFLYREFPGYGGQQAVWLGSRWKGIRTELQRGKTEPDLRIQLYDLIEDPSEEHDVSAENPEVVTRIETLMTSERVPSIAFPFPALDKFSGK